MSHLGHSFGLSYTSEAITDLTTVISCGLSSSNIRHGLLIGRPTGLDGHEEV